MAVTLLTPQEAADVLKISRRQVYKLVDRGELQGVRFGGTVRVYADSLSRLVEAGRANVTS